MSNVEDANLFMMCESPNMAAYSDLPPDCHIRAIRPGELPLWMAFPFDDEEDARANRGYMERFFQTVYGGREDEFFARCAFVCGADDRPVGTLFAWRVYGCVTTLHWFKVRKESEGLGIGRALLTHVMRGIAPAEYPVFLHTQPGSYRAIKLYADFGFALLTDPQIGPRANELERGLGYLREHMSPGALANLRTASAPAWFLEAVSATEINQF